MALLQQASNPPCHHPDMISNPHAEATARLSDAPADGLQLVHVDEALVVVDKPAGLLSVPGRGADKQDSVATRVQRRFADALVVHRLDQATSGLLMLARGAAVQRQLSRWFADRLVAKGYEAVVQGIVQQDEGEIDLPLWADWPQRPRQKVDRLLGKPSVTRYRVLHRDLTRQITRLALEPVTGRTHQLRVHLLAIGHPIVGDRLYTADGSSGTDSGARAGEPRLLLHATQLRLTHPQGLQPLALSSSAPF